jgi:hypothetical protein
MKGTRHSEKQVIGILKQGEAGLATAELCRLSRRIEIADGPSRVFNHFPRFLCQLLNFISPDPESHGPKYAIYTVSSRHPVLIRERE